MTKKLNICCLTKQKFKYHDGILSSDGFLGRQDRGLIGIPWESMGKLVLIGFRSDDPELPYKLDLKDTETTIVGPEKESGSGATTKGIKELFGIVAGIFKNRNVFRDIDLIYSEFREYTFFEVFLIKLFARRAKTLVYLIGDFPEANYERYHSAAYKHLLELLIKLSQLLSDEFWFMSKYLAGKYKFSRTEDSCVIHFSNLQAKEISPNAHDAPKGRISLVYVARLEKEKRPEIIINAAKVLEEHGLDVDLKVIGDGALRNDLEDLARGLGLEKNVRFYGKIVDRSEIFGLYKDSDIFAFSSIKGEGIPLVLMEAISQGLPIVAAYFGGIDEIIENGVNGFLISANSPEETAKKIAEKIEYLYEHPAEYISMSQKGLEKVDEFTIESVAALEKKRLGKLLETELLQERSPKSKDGRFSGGDL
jgi:glycosyltransferase involved in cell wall biosynthesis